MGLIVLLLLSAYFSGTETAFFSLNQLQKRRMAETPRGSRVLHLLQDPGKLLSAILLGNTFVNVAASSLAAGITADLLPEHGTVSMGAGVLVMTFLLLVFGEVSPKTIARARNREWAEFVSGAVGVTLKVFSPLASLVTYPADLVNRYLPGVNESDKLRATELYVLMELAMEEGVLTDDGATAVAILELDNRRCVSAMVPREDVVFFMSDWSVERMKSEAMKGSHTCYPFVDVSSGLMTGLIDVRDLLGREVLLVRTVPFFPESARLSQVLFDLRSSGARMGAVVDEYGDWTGIISLEDILDRVVSAGSSDSGLPDGVAVSGNGFLVPGSLSIDLLSDLLDSDDISAKYAESCAGLLQEITGKLPRENDVVLHNGYRFRVLQTTGNKIDTVFVERIPGK